MDVQALRLLIDVAHAGSFAAVARARGVEASSISRSVAAIEHELGLRLLQRTTRAMSLTDAGQAYLAAIAPAVEAIEAAGEDPAGTDPSGSLRITASAAFGEVLLAPLLPAFREAYPRLRLDLVLSDANLDLVAERIDIALRLAPSHRADVIGVRLFRTRYRVVASPGWLALHGAPRHPRELAALGCVVSAVPAFRARWLFRQGGCTEEVSVQGHIISSNAMLLRAAARAGLGPALLADWLVADDLADGQLIDLFTGHDVAASGLETFAWLLYPSRQHLPPRLRAAIGFLRARLTRDAGPSAPGTDP